MILPKINILVTVLQFIQIISLLQVMEKLMIILEIVSQFYKIILLLELLLLKLEENSEQGKAYIYNYNGSYWNENQILIASDGNSNDKFGDNVAISQNYIIIGAPFAQVGNNSEQGKAYIYNFNGNFGINVAISQNYIVIGAPNAQVGNNYTQGKAYIYNFNGSYWNQHQILIASDGNPEDNFGTSISISQNYIVIGARNAQVGNNYAQGKAYIYNFNGSYWNQNQILKISDGNSEDNFGSSVAIAENYIVIGAYGTDSYQGKSYVFNCNETYCNQEETLIANDGKADDKFGSSASISSNFLFISAYGANSYQGKAYCYKGFTKPPNVNVLNCSSLFSSFECYWDEIQTTLNDIEYQINFDNNISNWELIESPILEEGNIYYQQFNSSLYPNITGNEEYSIKIRSCNKTTKACGDYSGEWNLTTKIDSVKNYQLEYLSTSAVFMTWNYPNVPIINSVPKLDHYIIYYQEESSNETNQVSVSNHSKSYELTGLKALTNYTISICGCETDQCMGEEKGEVISLTIITLFSQVLNLFCMSSGLDVLCSWDPPNDSITPSYYDFNYKSISNDDSKSLISMLNSEDFKAVYSNQEYQVNVSACDSINQCGYVSSTQVETGEGSSTSKNSKSIKIAVGIIVPVVVILIVILVIIFVRRKKNERRYFLFHDLVEEKDMK
ncbi:hypothetical protein M0811_05798 [Anaeramoeba ignava]|uniref:Fibronectin type-III domain-containing protein n=1 Tax=Anaeramoeba ignava TaxID=1746090 RepID=A0A9Q0RGF5_ANAIG|nr:hypothetical protein M0811_05798 [Anaeramoeba ignava]